MKVNGINQLWVSDLTYIRLRHKFVFLAVILDAFSRRVIGWALGKTLESRLAIEALQMALRTREPSLPGLVHHSDRGVQYAASDFVAMLLENGIEVSMSRRGNPYDNAKAESFMKTLKYEEVYRTEYQNLKDARKQMRRLIEGVYNRKRLQREKRRDLHGEERARQRPDPRQNRSLLGCGVCNRL